ncbi:hypothetical protein P3X46_012786 [Hevea brasiliensis]|uniref:AB hydrolase-1 domain-containing protein n=1 Tax=Hevea brasiliensis TaxID=3981 RepID=A0ABQ9MF92_HEVBR|nr:(S)-hydroxynitrile lyase-like [Hevea brasiliensis]KAJ9177579.1 hypothetical protein P3X46_012786 [Hevea brasiliensis]
MAVTHFVLIHTICHGAWVWHKLKPVLEAAGHKVTALDLVASGIDLRIIEQVGSFDAYSEPLLNFLETIPEGEKVILVGESCGGINVAIACDKYTDKIAAAVFHNSLMPDTVHSPSYVLDKFLEVFPDWKDSVFESYTNGDDTITTVKLGPYLMENYIYTDCHPEDLELAKMSTRKGSTFREILAKREFFTKKGYGSIKKIYIYGDEDKIMTEDFHQWQIQNYKPEKLYVVPGGGHKLMLSRVNDLFTILQEVADTYAYL